MLYRFHLWGATLPEWPAPFLAQSETIVEKGYNAVMQGGAQFGNSSDSVRFGIILFALLLVVGALAYLYVAGDRATIRELKAENKGLREEVKANLRSYEGKYDELRQACDKKTEGFWGILQVAVAEVAAMNRVMQGMGIHVQRPPVQVSPPAPVTVAQEPQRAANFLPAGPRRIRPRPENSNEK